MGLFDKIKGPVFIKYDNLAEQQLAILNELKETATGDILSKIEEEIRCVEAGFFGEKSIRYELENSHIPMLILHDLYLEYNGLTAQIDYLIITRKLNFVIECKNLYGNIEITSSGDFVRTMNYGSKSKKEGIYSPITQNRRHLELIKDIRSNEKTNILTKAIFEKYFYNNYRSIVVLANPKTILYDKYAKKEVKDQVIKVDQLVAHIRNAIANSKEEPMSEKNMETLAQFFLGIHKKPKTDYTEKFRVAIELATPSESPAIEVASESPAIEVANIEQSKNEMLCPKCGAPMIKRIAAKGSNAGKEFFGCSKYPKCRSIVNI